MIDYRFGNAKRRAYLCVEFAFWSYVYVRTKHIVFVLLHFCFIGIASLAKNYR